MSLTKTEMLKNSALEVSMASRVLMAEMKDQHGLKAIKVFMVSRVTMLLKVSYGYDMDMTWLSHG